MFGLAVSQAENWIDILIVFTAIHLFLYPASNGYNSYFDKDEQSIGGLKHPPKVSTELYWASLLFDGLAIGMGLLVSLEFSLMLFVYGLVSKAYSHPSIRLKKYPLISWFIAGLFQGAFTLIMVIVGLKKIGFHEIDWTIIHPALLSSALLWGSYPMTQVYQHEEDARRGDITLSLKLGVKGTFIFTGVVFAAASLFYWFYLNQFSSIASWTFIGSMLPVIGFFNWWFFLVLKDEIKANFTHTMRLNLISSLCLNVFFGWLYYYLLG